MKSLLLIDGNAILHRAYHALPPLTTKSGEPINAVYGFTSMLIRLITDLKPTNIAVCFDTPKPTFRKAEYVGYQANRPQLDSDLSPQFEKMYETLKAMNIPLYAVPGYEADDVIGTISKQITENHGREIETVIIVTGDKDILQLVDDSVKVYMPVKGLTDAKMFGREEVVERMGVPPEEIADLKAFMGDQSDNYPGVKGIGPKTAQQLLKEFRSVEEVYKNINKISPKVAKKLAEDAEMAVLGKKLATIVRDVPITLDFNATKDWKIDDPKLIQLFSEFGFKTLTKRVQDLGEMLQKEKQISLL